MKVKFIAGLLALQAAAVLPASAQNYYIKLGGDKATKIADHAIWEQSGNPTYSADTSLELYNLYLPTGEYAQGLMRFHSPSGTLGWASHYKPADATMRINARRILMPAFNMGLYVIGEKMYPDGSKTVSIQEYDQVLGSLLRSYELPKLPSGYKLLQVCDVTADPFSTNAHEHFRVLCIVMTDSGKEAIMEMLFNNYTGNYAMRQFDPNSLAPDHYLSVHYIRAYHYSEFNLGEKYSFYGMGEYGGATMAYAFLDGKFQRYDLYSANGKQNVTGVQMNGSYGNDGSHYRIDMAFIDYEGDLCVQQKDELTTLNWRRFYELPDGKFRMGWGRDGHGTKQGGGMDYFIGVAHIPGVDDPEGRITTLHYDAANGNMMKPNIYNLSGIGVNKGGGFPNTVYDPLYDYTFIADRFKPEHGFKFGTGNAINPEIKCTKHYDLKEIEARIIEKEDEMKITEFDSIKVKKFELKKVGIEVSINEECKEEQRPGGDQGIAQLPVSSELLMDANQLKVNAGNERVIASLSVYSIDGRQVSNAQHVNSGSYKTYFSVPLTPGIYMLKITYDDRSTEVRKVSIR